jgi:5-methyltetrahydrofolate--homocysteine methyltransferase
MSFRDYLKQNTVYLDGGMGTLLQKCGLKPGEQPERWNITHPDIITKIHTDYFRAGSNVVSTNTFGANILKFSEYELEAVIEAAVRNARLAKEACADEREKFIALDIGPTGKLLRPYGDLDFEDAVSVFAKTVRLGVKHGVDLILIETMNDSYETKAALLAAKENSTLPVIVTNAYGEDGKLMTGASPEAMATMLEGMGADAIGANCSLGPKQLSEVVKRLIKCSSVPVAIKPNAGLPKAISGETIFDITADEFANEVEKLIKAGVRLAGGCCGTTPEYIEKLFQKTNGKKPRRITKKNITAVSSYTHRVEFGKSPILIGERINPTGKKRFKEALLAHDMNYILDEAIRQQEQGAHILDVNVGLPTINEAEMLKDAVCELQAVVNLPLQIDTASTEAMENALRRYNGKALINSVNGKAESMDAIFPLAKKYGGVIIALTLDEGGIPETAEGRVRIAKKILKRAKEYGIDKKDIVFDTLAMTVSTGASAADATLSALGKIRNELGCHTSLGISNISYGLPNRDAMNGVFFALALEAGLSAAIMNPYSTEMMKTYYAFRALRGLDENCLEYINAAESFIMTSAPAEVKAVDEASYSSELEFAIAKGFKEKAASLTRQLLASKSGIEIVNEQIIPALNSVGVGYESKRIFLPQLLMSAEAAKAAFDAIKEATAQSGNEKNKGPFVIATVEGDIHDIGKNIVRLLLENYGFRVIDLGKDVPPEKILDEVLKSKAPLLGLSALMTTTLPAMEKTVKLIRKNAPNTKIIVGGAVLTRDYAEKIGADKYAKDAMETVRYSENVILK